MRVRIPSLVIVYRGGEMVYAKDLGSFIIVKTISSISSFKNFCLICFLGTYNFLLGMLF